MLRRTATRTSSPERDQKQTDEAVDGGSKGQIELRRKTVEHRRALALGQLLERSGLAGGGLLKSRPPRNHRDQGRMTSRTVQPRARQAAAAGGEERQAR